MEYNQRMIIRFLHNEGADIRNIIQILQTLLTQDAYALRTVQFWIGEVCCGRKYLHDENYVRRPPLDDLDMNILAILDKSPFESARSIVETLGVGLIKVLRRLHDSIGFKSFHLHWVPHVLTVGLREKRTEYAQVMLLFLHVAERDG
jgi:hypothetical protein